MVRLATQDDILTVSKLLQQYSYVIDIKAAKEGFSLHKTTNLVHSCLEQGLVWVYEYKGRVVGCLVAREQFSIFSETIKEIHLIAIYVIPEHRSKTAGGRLLLAFDKKCGDTISYIGTQHTSTLKEQSLNKLGYRLAEKHYIKE